MTGWARVQQSTAHLQAPLAAVDVRALNANADDLIRRARGVPVRLATKSIRVRAVLDRVHGRPGFHGLMAYSLSEAIWLARSGFDDVLVAYPSVDRTAFSELVADPELLQRITVMIDDPEHLRIITQIASSDAPVRACLDVDASLRIGPAHLGVRRSPLHSQSQVVSAARVVTSSRSVRLVGLMFYDAQIAGLSDSSPAVRAVKGASARELNGRRPRIVEAVSKLASLEIVNGGGTGSLDAVSGDRALTEVAAGSGLYGPTLFDDYRDFTPEHAFAYALPVVRRPAKAVRTLFSGGFVASGPASATRQPTPYLPSGLSTLSGEGAGEVQTPVRGAAASSLAVGDRVWWRHAKAGEVCERFAQVHLVEDDANGSVTTVPTYRGEGQCFG